MNPLHELTVTEARRSLVRGDFSCAGYVDAVLARVGTSALQGKRPGRNAPVAQALFDAGALLTADGLPVGLELDGPAGRDRRLLAIAAAIETVLPRLPPPPGA